LAFAGLFLAGLAIARFACAVGLVTALRLFAALGESTVRALVVAARLLRAGLVLACFLALGLLSGFGLLLAGALLPGAAIGLFAPGIGLPALVAGAPLRCLPALGLLALLARAALRLHCPLALLTGAALGLLAVCRLAAGLLSVIAATLGG